MKKIISTWIYLDSKEEETISPQVGGKSYTKKFQETYWRCVTVFFESSLRYHPDAEHILFTNSNDLPVVDGLDIRRHLERNKVKVINVNHRYILPDGYYGAWRSQSFILSIIDYMKGYMAEEDKFMLLDSDCVFSKPVHEIFESLDKHNAMTYVINYGERDMFSSMNRVQMQEIFSDMGLKLDEPPLYCGGEVVMANGKFIRAVANDLPEFFNKLIRRFKENKSRLTEDGQMMTYFYYKHQAWLGGMNNYIKRLWTNPHILRSIKEEHRDLSIWHLPAEKKEGIHDLFQFIAQDTRLRDQPEIVYQNLIYDRLMDDKKYQTLSKKLKFIKYHPSLSGMKKVYKQIRSLVKKEAV